MRSIQSGEEERADLSGRSGRGHLVLQNLRNFRTVLRPVTAVFWSIK